MTVHEGAIRLELEPLAVLLRHTLRQLQAQDAADVFALPVPVAEVNSSVVNQYHKHWDVWLSLQFELKPIPVYSGSVVSWLVRWTFESRS